MYFFFYTVPLADPKGKETLVFLLLGVLSFFVCLPHLCGPSTFFRFFRNLFMCAPNKSRFFPSKVFFVAESFSLQPWVTFFFGSVFRVKSFKVSRPRGWIPITFFPHLRSTTVNFGPPTPLPFFLLLRSLTRPFGSRHTVIGRWLWPSPFFFLLKFGLHHLRIRTIRRCPLQFYHFPPESFFFDSFWFVVFHGRDITPIGIRFVLPRRLFPFC